MSFFITLLASYLLSLWSGQPHWLTEFSALASYFSGEAGEEAERGEGRGQGGGGDARGADILVGVTPVYLHYELLEQLLL